MTTIETIPQRPLQVSEVERLNERGPVSITPVNTVVETNRIHSCLLDSDGKFVAAAFDADADEWTAVGRTRDREALTDLWEELENWAKENFNRETEHIRGESGGTN